MSRTPKAEKTNVIIIGGGPSGISAAIWSADLGMSSVIIERETDLYGQLRWIHNPITNYPGISARDGAELIEYFERSVQAWKVRTELNAAIVKIDCENKVVQFADGREFIGDAIFIATGVRRRTLNIPGEKEFEGRGILRSGAGDRVLVTGKRVVVVGGGDAAAENALLLAEHAERVFLVHRRPELSARSEFRDRIAAAPNVEFLPETRITALRSRENLEFVEAAGVHTGESFKIEADHFIARIGVVPNSELVAAQIDQDEHGYIIVDHEGQTNLNGVYAIGDVANPISPTISTAVGTGATAAKSAFALLTSIKAV